MKHKHFIYSLLFGILFLSASSHLCAQGKISANPDNFFVNPVSAGESSSSTYLNVLLNDYYADDGSIGDLEVSIIKEPFKGYVQYDASSYRLEYLPIDGQIGTDSLIYKIRSKITGRTSQATVYIHLNDKPGVISDADCFVEPAAMVWGIKELASSNDTRVVATSNVWTGDIDGDGEIEILALRSSTPNNYNSNRNYNGLAIYVMDEDALRLKYDLIIEVSNGHPHEGVAIANVDGGTTSAIFFTSHTGVLYKYTYNVNTNNFEEDKRVTFGNRNLGNYYRTGVPIVTDLMGDGHQQIILYDKIYDASTLELLIDAQLIPSTGKSIYSFGSGGHQLTHVQYASTMLAVDIDGDGIQEIIGGDCVYKVNIDYNVPANNQYYLYRRANKSPLDNTTDLELRNDIADGSAAIADFDLDGYMDVVVVSGFTPTTPKGSVYVYNPRTGKIMHTNIVNDIPKGDKYPTNVIYGPSAPFVGDIDGDGYPEICLTGFLTLRAYDLDGGNNLSLKWDLPTTDTSAATTLSIFDFTQSGKSQLIYRDQTQLRIIEDDNGTPVIRATFDNIISPTINEYCIVADVNGDGAAEIIVTGSDRYVNPAGDLQSTGNYYGNGPIRVYASTSVPWAPARPVWNQLAYNPLYVNDDLTIPAHPISPATKFVSADGTQTRPFNNFLQQATKLNKEGSMIMEGADLSFSLRAPRRLSWESNGDLTITVTITNQGLVSWTHPIPLQMYCSQSGSPTTYTAVGSAHIDANTSGLPPRAERTISYTIPAAQVPAEGSYDGWAITVNLTTDPGENSYNYAYGDECRSGLNNRALGFNVLDGLAIACEGAVNVPVSVNPAGVYKVNWYTLGGSQVATASDTYLLPKKNSEEVTKLLVQAINKNTGLPVSNVRDTVYIYRSPDSLVWTNGAADRDWHNPLNWSKGGASVDKYPFANIPMGCTTVTLPGGMPAYPDLKDATNGGHTDYSLYTNASCGKVYFDFGSEIERVDLLVYDSARVETRFESHRWYMFAPPLKQTYSGDFYINSAIPSKDIVKSYTKSWGGIHPFWGVHIESSWTSIYNLPNVEYQPGYGLGVWISDKQDRDNVFFNFQFPKSDSEYYIYFEDTDSIDTYFPAMTTNRASSHRFIFDGQGAAGSSINLAVEAKKAGSIVFVGNPFMSQLDFDKFHTANAGKIKGEYKILNRNNNSYLYYKKGQASQLTKNIAPMQGFLVEALVPFTSLSVNGNMTASAPGNTLRSGMRATQEESSELVLPITVRQGNASDVSYLVFGQNYDINYNKSDDVMCLFDERGNSGNVRPVSIYSLSKDNIKMNMQTLPSSLLKGTYRIPLGLRTPSNEDIVINVGNLGSLPQDVQLSLYDSETNQSYSLSVQSMYRFDNVNVDANYFLNSRFYLDITRSSTDIRDDKIDDITYLWADSQNGNLSLHCGDVMDKVEIFSLQGALLHIGHPQGMNYDVSLATQSLYVIRVYTSAGVQSLKVINRSK